MYNGQQYQPPTVYNLGAPPGPQPGMNPNPAAMSYPAFGIAPGGPSGGTYFGAPPNLAQGIGAQQQTSPPVAPQYLQPPPRPAGPPQAMYGQNPPGPVSPAYGPPQPAPQYAPAPGQGGRKKALLIGCVYPGTEAELQGCINDVQCIQYCLKTKFGFQDQDIVILRDDIKDINFTPTKQNIIRAIKWLVEGAKAGDSLFFHFSGHGSQKVDRDGDEVDGYDETLLPTDYKKAGEIVDDDLNRWLVRPIPSGCVLHAIVDACHSGTALDLPFYTKVKSGSNLYWKGSNQPQKGTSGGTVIQMGACRDGQVAQDTSRLSGQAHTGAFTYSFIETIERYGTRQTYADLLQHMHDRLRTVSKDAGMGGLAGLLTGVLLTGSMDMMKGQTPVICCDKPLDLYRTTLMI